MKFSTEQPQVSVQREASFVFLCLWDYWLPHGAGKESLLLLLLLARGVLFYFLKLFSEALGGGCSQGWEFSLGCLSTSAGISFSVRPIGHITTVSYTDWDYGKSNSTFNLSALLSHNTSTVGQLCISKGIKNSGRIWCIFACKWHSKRRKGNTLFGENYYLLYKMTSFIVCSMEIWSAKTNPKGVRRVWIFSHLGQCKSRVASQKPMQLCVFET